MTLQLFFPVLLIAMGLLATWTPRWTKRELLFGVTVEPAFRDSDAGRAIFRVYDLHLWAWVAASVVLYALPVAGLSLHTRSWVAFGTLWAGSILAFRTANQRARVNARPAASMRVAEISRDRSLLEHPVVLWSGLLLIAAAALFATAYPHPAVLLSRVALTRRWTELTALGGRILPTALGCVTGIFLMFALLRHGTRRKAVVPGQRHLVLRNAALGYYACASFVAAILTAAAFGQSPPHSGGRFLLAILIAVLLTSSVLMYRHVGVVGPAASAPAGDKTPDAAWKWGMIYWNPDDAALLVEKRSGPGYTLNFGNRRSWLLVTALAVLVTVLIAR